MRHTLRSINSPLSYPNLTTKVEIGHNRPIPLPRKINKIEFEKKLKIGLILMGIFGMMYVCFMVINELAKIL